jgi:hypothetical protein
MKFRNLALAGLASAALLAGGYAVVAQMPPIILPNGQPTPQSQYVSGATLMNAAGTQPGNNPANDLIGGDFGTNLFQDGTSVGTITTSATYVADQWFAFSGTSTTIGGAQETGAADIPAGYTASLRITRSGSGVIQSCVGQIIPGSNVARYQGQTMEIDAHALAGAGFSAANSNLTFIQVQGTGVNDTAANFAKTINSALSGTAWAGAVVNSVNVPINTAWNRYGVAFPVALTTTETGVALCWTPVGASPSSDYFEFVGAQVVPNNSLASVAGTTGGALLPNDPRAKSFLRRQVALETDLQLAFYYRQNESTANIFGVCQETSSTNAFCSMTFPVPMFKTPTIAYTAGGISATLGSSQAAVAITGLAIKANGATTYGAQLTATASSGLTALTGFLEGTTTTGSIAFSARF